MNYSYKSAWFSCIASSLLYIEDAVTNFIDDIFTHKKSSGFSWCIHLAALTSYENVNLHSWNSNLGEVYTREILFLL